MRGTRHTRSWLAIAVVLVALGFAGCGGDGDDAASDAADAVASGGDDAGDASPESGSESGGELDSSNDGSDDSGGDDFPIAVPDGLLLDALADAGVPMDSQRQLFFEDDDFDRIVTFYDDWTTENGEWSRGESEGTVVYQQLDGDSIQMITVSPGHDAGAQADGPVTFVLLVAG